MATQILGKVAYTSRGAYDSSFLYEINDVVTYNGSSYVSLKETKGNLPTNENYWMLLAQKGDTYEVTKDDLNNIANQITEDANSLFNQNVDTKTEEFNTNASNKTDEFNSNATSKTETFNTNAETKLNEYNTNATSKVNAYDENATTKLSEYNTNADTRLQEFNDNADSYDERITANENNIAENTQRTRRIENNIFEAGEATGESINIQDSVLSELTGFRAKAVNTQKTTEGYNKLNPYMVNATTNGVTVTYNEETQEITLNGTCTTENTTFSFPKEINRFDVPANQKLYGKVKYISGSVSGSANVRVFDSGYAKTLKIPLENSDTRASISYTEDYAIRYTFIRADSTAVFNNYKIKVMLSFEDKDYEPYTNGASPNPDFPSQIPVIEAGEVVEVESVGDNTFKFAEKDEEYNGLSFKKNADGSLTINGTAITSVAMRNLFNILFPKVEKGATLGVKVISGSVTSTAGTVKPRLLMYDEIYNTNLVVTNLNQMSVGEFKYKNASTDFVPAFWYIDWNAGDVFDNFTIQGFYSCSGKTEYTPYVESNLTTSVPEGEFVGANDTTADEFYTEYNEEDKKEHIYLAKNVGRKILDGTEAWGMNFGTGMFHSTALIPSKRYEVLCSHFKYNSVKTGVYNALVDGECATNGNISDNKNIYFKYTVFSTFNEWVSYLAEQYANGNPIIVQYQLAEPYVIDLGAVDQLKTWTDVTNILNNSSIPFNMTANYYRNFISTIRNLQVNNGALQTELANLESRLSALETSVSNLQVSSVNESEVVEDVI